MRLTFYHSFAMILTASFTMRRSLSAAFVPLARTLVTTISKDATSGMRRARPRRRSEPVLELIDQLQRTKGLFRNIIGGSLIDLSDTSEQQVAELPSSFPLAGKNPALEPPRMRFAPSPTGSLHVGGARTALYNYLVAKKAQKEMPNSNAAFILRIEDTDVARSTKESEASVLADLKWLGLHWDEGPDTERTLYGPYRQSEREEIYFAVLQRLMSNGKAYRCFCTPEELEEMKAEQEARGEVARYDGRWRDADELTVKKMLEKNAPYTIRFKVPENTRIVIEDVVRGTVAWDAQATVGDFILMRSSKVPVYNFCVAVDDAAMGVTTVVRAEEHLTNTVRQALVLDALDAPRPRYAHCSLILGEDKQKLSKRHGATSCNQFRLDGFLPDAMINYLALLGWNDGTENEIFTRDELIDAFELERVVKSPSVFDMEKLKWVNGQHIKMMSVASVATYVADQLEWEGVWKKDISKDNQKVSDFTLATTALAKQMMLTTKDAVVNAKEVLSYGLAPTFAELNDSEARAMIENGNFYNIALKLVEMYESGELAQPIQGNLMSAFGDADAQVVEAKHETPCEYTANYMKQMKAIAKELGVKGKELFHPIRLALTGEMSGQDVTKQLSLVAMAFEADSPVDVQKINAVNLEDRMKRLRTFCDSIPEEFRTRRSTGNSSTQVVVNGAEASYEKQNENMKESSNIRNASHDDPMISYDGPPITALDIRVGRITKVWEHPDADKLYCEEIDVGEGEPRKIASGLRPYLKAEEMEGRLVLVLCNLKERNMLGFKSHGMVLCASNAEHSEVKLVNPPVDAKVGERVTVADFNYDGEDGQPFAENKVGKKKVLENIAPYLVTNKYGIPEFLGRPFMTSAGVCTSSIPNGSVS